MVTFLREHSENGINFQYFEHALSDVLRNALFKNRYQADQQALGKNKSITKTHL